jgi:AcrR family transcriptional regulator
MEVKQSRNAQAEGTRNALLRHARRLFTQKGYADASTDEVVRRAKVTKGALYHHFANKLKLYQAVVEDMEHEVVARIEAAAEARPAPGDRLRAACDAYLDACLDVNLARVLVIEAPVVLGWKTWCDIAQEHEVAAFAKRLAEAIAAGVVREQPLEMMAQVLLGALNTAARVIATAPDPKAARLQVEETIERLLQGLESSDISA